jgi:hypothetical protein
MGLILAAVLGVVTWRLTRATDKLITQGRDSTQALMKEVHADTQRTLAQMDERWQLAWERMDQRADERHREFVQALQAMRGS